MSTTPYTTICDHCFQGTWYTVEQPCKRSVPVYCEECHQHTGKEKPCPGTLRVIDNSQLDKRFYRFYQSGERVEVTYENGEKERFYVGKSTGWKPIYITLKKRNSNGGRILPSGITHIKPLGIYRSTHVN